MLLYPSPVPTLPPSFLKAPNPLQVSCESPDDSTTDGCRLRHRLFCFTRTKKFHFHNLVLMIIYREFLRLETPVITLFPTRVFIFFFFFSFLFFFSVSFSPPACCTSASRLIVSRLLIVIIRCNKHATSEARPEDVESQPDRLAVACGV